MSSKYYFFMDDSYEELRGMPSVYADDILGDDEDEVEDIDK